MDTVLSLEKGISYAYYNPGDGKDYIEQVLKNENFHFINEKCFQFYLYSKPYIIYKNAIFCLEQDISLSCTNDLCVPDTLGIYETKVYSLDLDKVIH